MSTAITDPEVRAFVERTNACYPSGAATLTVAEQRRLYDAMCSTFRAPRPAGIAVEEDAVGGRAGLLRLRRYRPSTPGDVRVVYYHGGGFVLGGLESHDDICAELCAATGCEVIAVDYRLAPEHPHPAAFEDALAAAWAALEAGPAILAGDSAGANLAAAAALRLRDQGVSPDALRGQVLIYPGLGGECLGLPSYRVFAAAPMLTTADVHLYRALRAGGCPPARDPSFDPLLADHFAGLAPAFISAAGIDPLRDDGPAYAERLREAGVAAECVIEAGLPHGHLRARHLSRRAGAAFRRIAAAVAAFAA